MSLSPLGPTLISIAMTATTVSVCRASKPLTSWTGITNESTHGSGHRRAEAQTVKGVMFFSDDWFSSIDIQRMSKSQELGFFRFLLAQSAAVQGKLPNNDAELGRLTRMGTREWRTFKSEFPHLLTESEGLIWNKKQHIQWLKHEKRSHDAKAAADARWMRPHMPGNDAAAYANADARPKDLNTTSQSQERKDSLSQPVEGDSVNTLEKFHENFLRQGGGSIPGFQGDSTELADDPLMAELFAWWKGFNGGIRKQLAEQYFVTRGWTDPEVFAKVRATFPAWEKSYRSGVEPGYLHTWIERWSEGDDPLEFTNTKRGARSAAAELEGL